MKFGVARTELGPRFALIEEGEARWEPARQVLPASLEDACALPLDQLRERLRATPLDRLERMKLREARSLLAPVGERQEVWAAGVTYERSRAARVAESSAKSVYDLVYEAERPELFFKSLPQRVAGPGQPVAIRSDSEWNVPEPELVLVFNRAGEIVGYTLGNDMGSRSIEGENPLYLPQAKVYERSCALGPAVVPAWELRRPEDLVLSVSVHRGSGEVFRGEVGVAAMRRSFDTLAQFLFRALRFPYGVLLLTGTGVVPPDDFTLQPGDEVRVTCDPIGELVNPVIEI